MIYRVIPGQRTFERITMITVAIVPNNPAIRRLGVIAALLEKKDDMGCKRSFSLTSNLSVDCLESANVLSPILLY